jgi:hypothetical protein
MKVFYLIFILIFFIFIVINTTLKKNEIVISRFNESLNWLNNKKFNDYNIICYNSGNDTNFYKPSNMKVVNIKNIGKEAYTYLYHIINNYNKLANITIFIPGSCENNDRQIMIDIILDNIKYNQTVFISSKHNNVQNNLYNFKLDYWCSTSNENFIKNNNCNLNLSTIRPFGLWYQNMFGNLKTTNVNYRGVIAIHKKHILQRHKSSYEKLLTEIKSPNDEVLHYFERSWEAIFYPLSGAMIIPYNF